MKGHTSSRHSRVYLSDAVNRVGLGRIRAGRFRPV